MKYRFSAIFLGLVGIGCALGQNAAQSTANPSEATTAKELQQYFDQLTAENQLSGAVLVAKDGIPIASKAVGLADRAGGTPITLSTRFNLGSLNKMFTAVAIAQLAQEGKLDFQDRIDKHLPDYPNSAVAGKVTIHHLLTHTSGLGSYWNAEYEAKRASLTTVAAHLPLFANDPLAFSPGEKFQYSNAGFMLLGAIIEKVSGENYYDYVRRHVYEPAAMNATGFYEPGPNSEVAIGYTREGAAEGKLRENTNLREVKGGPAGGGYSTVQDLVKFHMALRDHKLLNEEFTRISTTGKGEAGPQGKYAYGFGDKIFAGKHIVGHNGGAPGIAANLDMFPELGYTAVLLMNCDPPAMMPIIMKIRELIPGS
jgi:CubicO group peptidase (beta-lactamase class C family)